MRTQLYGQLAETQAVVPTGDLWMIGRMYQEMAKTGACSVAQRAALFDAGRAMIADQGAEAVVLAGTDLGLAFDGHDPGFPVIDALDVHVAVLAGRAFGHAQLPD
jgi:aspartate racemase